LSKYLQRGKLEIKEIGSRIEPLFDEWLISNTDNVSLKLQHPVPEEVVFEFDEEWEGNTCGYVTVFKDKDVFKMYYRASTYDFRAGKESHPAFVCYAESSDGIKWTRPKLNIIEFNGSKKNNIIWTGTGSHNFAPFIDTNPAVKENEKYKAVGAYDETGQNGLFGFASKDGINWELMKNTPIIQESKYVKFDSQNLVFYDNLKNLYIAYHRGWIEGDYNGFRVIMRSESGDFENWSESQFLEYEGDIRQEHLYTNAIAPYFRAPHIYIGFPKRFVPERHEVEHEYNGVSDGVLMTSRDGKKWKRWQEAFIRPGIQPERWINRNNMTAWGLLVTKSKLNPGIDEISLYSSEAYYTDKNRLRRFTIRLDGFVSINATGKQGQFITHPIIFDGNNLVLNYSTSAAGLIKVEIQDLEGKPVDNYSINDCHEIYGDAIEEEVSWKDGYDLSKLRGKPVRLRFVMNDADLYSIRFKN